MGGMGKVVTAPDGTRWRVGRRWVPWRLRRRAWDLTELPELPVADVTLIDELFGGVVAVVVALIGAVLFVLFVIPFLIAVLEAVLLLLVLVLGVVARVVLRRPWIVQAVQVGHHGRLAWKAGGWRRSGEVADVIARRLQAGNRDLDLGMPGVSRVGL